MTTKIISGTVITTGYTLSSSYSALSITSTGTIYGAPGIANNYQRGIGGAGLYSFHDAAVFNAGVIVGGQGGAGGAQAATAAYVSGGRGGYGVIFTLGTLDNTATVAGGRGGDGGISGTVGSNGGPGGIGVFMVAAATLINSGAIVAGAGGDAGPGLHGKRASAVYAGAGGVGVDMSQGVLVNNGAITGGEGGVGLTASGLSGGAGGDGGVGLKATYVDTPFSGGFILNNTGEITGGVGGAGGASVSGPGGSGGAGGTGVEISGDGPIVLGGTIIGGIGGKGGSSTSSQNGMGGNGGAGLALFTGPGVAALTATNIGIIHGGQGGGGTAGGEGGTGVTVGSVNDGIVLTNVGVIVGGLGGEGSSQSGAVGVGLTLELGSVVNEAQGLISGRYGLVVALSGTLSGGSTVTNFGTIEGAAGVSVALHDANDRLIAEAGSTWIGSVQGGGGTLELASGSGTISGLGSDGALSGAETMAFKEFARYEIDTGTNWTLSGPNSLSSSKAFLQESSATLTIAAGRLSIGGDFTQDGSVVIRAAADASPVIQTSGVWTLGEAAIVSGTTRESRITDYGMLLGNAGGGVATIEVATYDEGEIEASAGTFDFTGALAGTGSLKIEEGALIDALSSVARTFTVTFSGPSATLAMTQPKHFAATISGFAPADTLDLLRIQATGASVNGADQLVIVSGAVTLAMLQLTGDYSGATFDVARDGKGGTNITMTAAGNTSRGPQQLAQAMAGMADHPALAPSSLGVHQPQPPSLALPGPQVLAQPRNG